MSKKEKPKQTEQVLTKAEFEEALRKVSRSTKTAKKQVVEGTGIEPAEPGISRLNRS